MCLIALLIFPLNGVAQSNQPLLSPHIRLVEDRVDEVVLAWEEIDGVAPQGAHRALIFAHGPIDQATYTIDHFEWKRESDEGLRIGAQADYTGLLQPRVELRELGALRGSRLAALTLRLGDSRHNQDISFTRGVIRVRFSELDPISAERIPSDIAGIASRLCLNDPPRFAKTSVFPTPQTAPYSDRLAMKITASEPGVQTLSSSDIMRALGDDISIQELALFQNRFSAPFAFFDDEGRVKRDGPMAAQDRIVFYSPPSESPYSPQSVSWFTRDENSHRFMRPLEPTETREAENLRKRIRLEEDNLFIYGRDTNERQSDFWMWSELVSDATKALSFAANHWVAGSEAVFRARIAVDPAHAGISADDVRLEAFKGEIALSGVSLDQGRMDVVGEFTLPATLGESLELILSATTAQRLQSRNAKLYLDWAEVSATAKSTAGFSPYYVSRDQAFVLPEDAAFALLVDEDDPFNIRYALNAPPVVLESNVSGSIYFHPENAGISAATMETLDPESSIIHSLTQPANAEVLIIAPWAWREVLQSQVDSLQRTGRRARVVSVEAIYDCFGDGHLSPYAIRDYLRSVLSSDEGGGLSYVLLVGDATWDYWGRYQNNVVNIVPGYRGHPDYAVENWFARLLDPDDLIPDLMIGRWPVRTQEELVSVIQKNAHYKERPQLGDWLNRVLLTTDDGFESYMDELDEHWLPDAFRRTRRHIRDYPLIDNVYLPPQMRQALKAKTSLEATEETVELLNQGQFLWLFYGHGAPNVIGNERIFFGGGSVFSDVRKLKNMEHPFILWAFSCETCRFDFPRERWNISIGEDLLTHVDGGSIALFGATGRGFPHDHVALARGMVEAAFHWNLPTLGQQTLAAGILGLAQQRHFEPIDQFALLGDPTLAMPIWENAEGELVLDDEADALEATWRLDLSPKQTLSARIWAQSERDFVFLREEFIESNASEFHVSIPFELDARNEWNAVGFDAIDVASNRATVWRGALPIPQQPAPPIISPTTGRLPNLSFVEESIEFKPYKPRDGQTLFFHAEVENRGDASAEQIHVSGVILNETGQEETMRVAVGQQGALIERLDPGEQAPIRIRWDPVANAGEHRVALRIDPLERITQEEDEIAQREWEARLRVVRKADIVIHEASASLTPHASGEGYTLGFVIVNEGESAVDNLVVELIAHLREHDAPAIMRLPHTYGLRPGERRAFGGIGLPSALEAIEIVADPDEILDEESHANNRLTLRSSGL